jgi:hypothetical protein
MLARMLIPLMSCILTPLLAPYSESAGCDSTEDLCADSSSKFSSLRNRAYDYRISYLRISRPKGNSNLK